MAIKLTTLEIEGIKLAPHTIVTKEGKTIFGFMFYLSAKKMGFFSAERLANLNNGIRGSRETLMTMLKESVHHTNKGYDVAFGEAKEPEGAKKTSKKTSSKGSEDGDLCFDNINTEQTKAKADVKPVEISDKDDTYDVFDTLDVGF